MADGDMLRPHTDRLEDIELLQADISWHVRPRPVGVVGEDGQSRTDAGLADCSKHLALVERQLRAVGVLPDFTERTVSLLARLAHEIVGDLIVGFRRDVRRIGALHVEPAARDDVHLGPAGDRLQVRHFAAHVGVGAVDDAAYALGAGLVDKLRDHVDVVGDGRRRRSGWRLPSAAAAQPRQVNREMLVKQCRAGSESIRRNVFQDRPDNRALRKGDPSDLRGSLSGSSLQQAISAQAAEHTKAGASAQDPHPFTPAQHRSPTIAIHCSLRSVSHKSNCTPNLTRRPTSVEVGVSHAPPVAPLYLVFTASTGRALKAL